MTSQSKRVNVGGDAASKNTRRRIQQKRSRNKGGGSGGGGGQTKKTEDKPNPVIESSNPFFIAVCSPDSYKPKGSGRRHNEPVHAPPPPPPQVRTKPNVFLRQPSRDVSHDGGGGGGGGGPNQFIHHPRLQNERQRGGHSSSAVAVAASAAATAAATSSETVPNICDTEQFPSLSSSSTVVNTSKLNFKEMVMKNTIQAETPVSVTMPPSLPAQPEKKQKCQKISLRNIFSSVFYGSRDDDGGDGDGGDGGDSGDSGGGGGGGDGGISSILIDSCDRKYDNLYNY
jgi:hypothetical protein